MSLQFTFDQIKLAKNENLNNSVLNRPLARIYAMLTQLQNANMTKLPENNFNEIVFLSGHKLDTDADKTVMEWKTLSDISKMLPTNALTDLSDVSKAIPKTGETVVWNDPIKRWEYKEVPTTINDLANFSIVDNPRDKAVITWNEETQEWIAQTATNFLGVGYIYHKVCTKPTVVVLPTATAALTGGEQIVVTKLRKNGDDSSFSVLIVAPGAVESSGRSSSIFGYSGILTNNDNEDFASIHLRATIDTNGDFMWVPVAAMGTWKPVISVDINNLDGIEGWDDGGNPVDIPPPLTENQIKLQPYNIDLSLNLNEKDISQSFKIKLIKNEDTNEWELSDTSNKDISIFGRSVYYSPITKIISINHGVLEGFKLVRTTVFFHDEDANRLCQITPNEVYFEAVTPDVTNNYGTVNIDLSDWLNIKDKNELNFEVLISV